MANKMSNLGHTDWDCVEDFESMAASAPTFDDERVVDFFVALSSDIARNWKFYDVFSSSSL